MNIGSSPQQIYAQFRRIVQLWNTTRDANRVNELYDDIFTEDPEEYDEEELVSDVFHFVSNMNQLGQHPVRMPPTHILYNNGGVDAVMETSNIPSVEEDETDMEGDGRRYPNPLRRFRPIKGRKGRRAYPDEEYSSDEEVGGTLPIEENSGAPAIITAINNLLGRDVNTENQAREVDGEIRQLQVRLASLMTPRAYRLHTQSLNRNLDYIRISNMCNYTFDELDDLVGGSHIQPINHKPDHQYCCGGGMVQPVNPKFLPF